VFKYVKYYAPCCKHLNGVDIEKNFLIFSKKLEFSGSKFSSKHLLFDSF
jgi:hypothetical protein